MLSPAFGDSPPLSDKELDDAIANTGFRTMLAAGNHAQDCSLSPRTAMKGDAPPSVLPACPSGTLTFKGDQPWSAPTSTVALDKDPKISQVPRLSMPVLHRESDSRQKGDHLRYPDRHTRQRLKLFQFDPGGT
jgi:hypothetical protein